MNTIKTNAAAGTIAAALIVLTANAGAALAQRPTAPLGEQPPSPSYANCPDYI
jgi:hypothetical protein